MVDHNENGADDSSTVVVETDRFAFRVGVIIERCWIVVADIENQEEYPRCHMAIC